MSERRGAKGRRIVPTQLAALAAGVSEATIRKWASRGKLTRYGRPGKAQYDLDEVILVLSGSTAKRE
jgi:hypothetical protein